LEKTTLFHVEPVFKRSSNLSGLNAVAIVDPFSTGAVLASDLTKLGYKVIAVYSSNLEQLGNLQGLVPTGLSLSFESIILFDKDINVIIENLNIAATQANSSIVAVLAGAETGVELADQLSEKLSLRTNGTAHSEERRNKYAMGEAVRAAGKSTLLFCLDFLFNF
jgi:hypothetical protein